MARWIALSLVTAGVFAFAQQQQQPRSARDLLERREWKAAATAFAELAKAEPTNAEARIGLGIALFGLGDRAGALNAFRGATEINPASPEAHYNVALALREGGEPQRAAAELRTALKLRPGYEDARIALGLVLQQGGDLAGAVAHYQAVLKANPKSAEAHNWLGVALMQKNQLAEAAAALRTAIRLKPGFARAHNNLGSTLAQAGDLEGGIAAFHAGLGHAPDDLALRLNLGTALRNKGDAEAAIREFRFVLRRNPDNHEVHYQYALALREQGDLEGAIREFETGLDLNPEHQESYYGLAQTLRQMAAKMPRPPAAPSAEVQRHLNLAGEALSKKALDEAAAQLSQAVALEPESAELRYHLGAAHWYRGDAGKAAAELDEALRRNPAHALAASLRGIVHRESGDLTAAQRLLQHAAALNPRTPASFFDLAVVFLRRNRLAHALGQFEAGLNLPVAPGAPPPDIAKAIAELRAANQPPEAETHVVLGRLLGLAGADAKLVAAEFEAALKLRPEMAEAHDYLGLVHTQTNDDAKAVAAFGEAIRLRPDYADAHANLGAVLTATDAAGAVKELERALELQPRLLKAQYNLALAYGSSPKHGVDREIATLRKLLSVEAGYPRADFALGKALLRKGIAAEAVTHLRKAMEAEPRFGEAQYQLGLALTRAGRGSEAEQYLKSGRELVAATQREQTTLLDVQEGQAALDRGEIDQAIVKFRQAIAARPDLAAAHRGLELALKRQGDEAEQVRHFESFIRAGRFAEVEPRLQAYVKERPDSAWGWYALGYAQFAQRRIGDAITSLAKSLSIDLTNAEAHKVLGRSLMIIGRFDVAQREFELGEKYSPGSAEIPFNLGRLHSIQDQWPAARQAFERAIRNDPAYMEAYDGLGFALEALGEDAAALAAYEKAVKLNQERAGSFVTPLVNLSAYHLRHENGAAAYESANQAVKANPQSDRAWFQLGRAREQRGEMEAAAEAVERAVALNGRAATYHYVLGRLYKRTGKQKESEQAMETFARLNRESNELEQKRLEFQRQETTRQ